MTEDDVHEIAVDTLTEWLDGRYIYVDDAWLDDEDPNQKIQLVSADGPLIFRNRETSQEFSIVLNIREVTDD